MLVCAVCVLDLLVCFDWLFVCVCIPLFGWLIACVYACSCYFACVVDWLFVCFARSVVFLCALCGVRVVLCCVVLFWIVGFCVFAFLCCLVLLVCCVVVCYMCAVCSLV